MIYLGKGGSTTYFIWVPIARPCPTWCRNTSRRCLSSWYWQPHCSWEIGETKPQLPHVARMKACVSPKCSEEFGGEHPFSSYSCEQPEIQAVIDLSPCGQLLLPLHQLPYPGEARRTESCQEGSRGAPGHIWARASWCCDMHMTCVERCVHIYIYRYICTHMYMFKLMYL